MKNPVLTIPLSSVMRSEIALPLQHVLKLYSVGSLLNAWRNPKNHRSIEQVFDNPRYKDRSCPGGIRQLTVVYPDDHTETGPVGSNLVIDEEGRHPDPYTLISAEDARTGRWRINSSGSLSTHPSHAAF